MRHYKLRNTSVSVVVNEKLLPLQYLLLSRIFLWVSFIEQICFTQNISVCDIHENIYLCGYCPEEMETVYEESYRLMFERLLNKPVMFSIKRAFHIKNIIYVLLWTIISLGSSFYLIPNICNILGGDLAFLFRGDFYETVVAPLLIWVIAFFADYLYCLWTIGEDERLDTFWIKVANFIVFFIFCVLVVSLFYHETDLQQGLCMICMIMCMIGLKTASLCVVKPSYEIVKR